MLLRIDSARSQVRCIFIAMLFMLGCGGDSSVNKSVDADSLDDVFEPADIVVPTETVPGEDTTGTDNKHVEPRYVCEDEARRHTYRCSGNLLCTTDTFTESSQECHDCFLDAMLSCGQSQCVDEPWSEWTADVEACLYNCTGQSNPVTCLLSTCPRETLEGIRCVDRKLAEGVCDDEFALCGFMAVSSLSLCAQCRDAHRVCEEKGEEISCTNCLPGYLEKDGECEVVTTCEGQDCGGQGLCEMDGGVARCICENGSAVESGMTCKQPFFTNEWLQVVKPGESVTFSQGFDESVGFGPCHPVTIEDPYSIQRYEVTEAEYLRCVRAGFCEKVTDCNLGDLRSVGDPATSQHPVVCVSVLMAERYCKWVGGALPTESQWEYAALGLPECNNDRLFPWGSATISGAYANYLDSGDPFETTSFPFDASGGPTTPVGFFDGSLRTRSQSGWIGGVETFQTEDNSSHVGAYDMAGNVSEWVRDCWYEGYFEKTEFDGSAWSDSDYWCDLQTKKSEAWSDSADALVPEYRAGRRSMDRFDFMGFRCVLPLD